MIIWKGFSDSCLNQWEYNFFNPGVPYIDGNVTDMKTFLNAFSILTKTKQYHLSYLTSFAFHWKDRGLKPELLLSVKITKLNANPRPPTFSLGLHKTEITRRGQLTASSMTIYMRASDVRTTTSGRNTISEHQGFLQGFRPLPVCSSQALYAIFCIVAASQHCLNSDARWFTHFPKARMVSMALLRRPPELRRYQSMERACTRLRLRSTMSLA